MSFDRSATEPTFVPADLAQAVWFLGALVRVRVGGSATAATLAVLEHTGTRGYGSPLHSHVADNETFLVLDGELRAESGAERFVAGPGSAVFLPRERPHAFVVTSSQARFLTLHTPAGFDAFTVAAGIPAVDVAAGAPDLPPPDPAELIRLAAGFGIEILGPPPSP